MWKNKRQGTNFFYYFISRLLHLKPRTKGRTVYNLGISLKTYTSDSLPFTTRGIVSMISIIHYFMFDGYLFWCLFTRRHIKMMGIYWMVSTLHF